MNQATDPRDRLVRILVGVGLIVCCAVAWYHRDALGYWRLAVYGGAALVAAAVGFPRRITDEANDQDRSLAEARRLVARELSDRSAQLDRREQQLAERLLTYQTWLEFPQPVDLSDTPGGGQELSELARRDRQLFELLERETERLFNAIRDNDYAPEGTFDFRLAREDAYSLIRRVAAIYRPDLDEPLLETSLARVLPAASRVCLQFLVALDELPLNVKERSLASIYRYVRNAVRAYGVYRVARPYFPYVNTAYYLGRYAMGGNPLTMGAWWFLSHVGKKGAETMATRIVNRQALALLNNLVRAIGFEVAGIYGGDFRHRDPNWFYAVELTDLVSQFALTEGLLAGALREIGIVQLRGEYDRVYLYRCVASHRSAQPRRYHAQSVLGREERLAVAARIDDFIDGYLRDAPAGRLDHWRETFEQRLQVRIQDAAPRDAGGTQSQKTAAVRELAAFLLVVKQCDLDEIAPVLDRTELFGRADADQRRRWTESWHESPPSLLQRPPLPPDSPLVDRFLDDLILLETTTRQRGAQNDDLIVDIGLHLRQDPQRTIDRLNQAYARRLIERFADGAAVKDVSVEATRAILDLLDDEERLRLAYHDISIERPVEDEGEHLWLFGTEGRCLLIDARTPPQLLWRADGELKVETSGGVLRGDCRIEGGRWLADEEFEADRDASPPRILLRRPRWSRSRDYFRPLLETVSSK